MDSAVTETVPVPSLKTVLARVNHRLALLRMWLSHDHRDEPFWWARQMTARDAQRERLLLRPIATLLHTERATHRGRLHGNVFKSLDEQRAYVEAEHYFPSATRELIGLPSQVINFRLLRGGTSAPV